MTDGSQEKANGRHPMDRDPGRYGRTASTR